MNPEAPNFTDMFRFLLRDVEFEEPVEMAEARMAVSEALTKSHQDPDFLRSVWEEYDKICEQTVDAATPQDADPPIRARLQIATLVHKALIFREIGDTQRYGEELAYAEDYAFNTHLDAIAEAIGTELDNL
jgi:hypothetical protein